MTKTKNVEDIYLLAPSQHSLLMHLLLESPRREVYFEQFVWGLTGDLDSAAWRRAWERVHERHPALRSHFLWEKVDRPLQVVRSGMALPWEEHDLSALSEEQCEIKFRSLLEADVERGFDFKVAPLSRCALVRMAPDRHYFIWSFTHLLVDGWSLALVLAEARALYEEETTGKSAELPPAAKFRDYVSWVESQDLGRAEKYWRAELAGFEEATPLPYDGSGRELQPGERRSAYQMTTFEGELASRIESFARAQKVTLSTVFQAVWALVLGRLTGKKDVVYGMVSSGRPPELPGVDRMVGLAVNGLPTRARLEGSQKVGDWLREIQRKRDELTQWEFVAGEQIRAWSDLPRRVPVFESLMIFQNYPIEGDTGASAAIDFHAAATRESSNHPLVFTASPQAGQLSIRFLYHADRFSSAAITDLLGRVEVALEGLIASADQTLAEVPVIGAAELARLVTSAAGVRVERPAGLLHQLFERAAGEHAHKTALIFGDQELTYAELDAQADVLAAELQARGVGPEVVVGLAIERSLELIIGFLGVLKAGGAYLPLDPDYPHERLTFMIEDSGAHLLVATAASRAQLPQTTLPILELDARAPLPASLPTIASGVVPEGLAYVIYTSGSTGKPKGVGVPHSAAVHYTLDSIDAYEVKAEDRLLQFSAVAFDTAAEEIYPALATGATLILRDRDYTGFMRRVVDQGITVLNLPTAVWHDLARDLVAGHGGAEEVPVPAGLRLVIIGGEAAQPDRLEAWHKVAPPTVKLLNTYGPTEATIVSTRADLSRPAPGPVTIGFPISNATTYLLDRRSQLVPDGSDAELCLGGPGLTRGYLGRPALTAAAFVPDPFASSPGERIYRSGDLARRISASDPHHPGEIEFRGRVDAQVKVRGYRVELGEIESALRGLPGVKDAVVLARGERGDNRIVAYWVPTSEGAKTNQAELRQALAERLPDYMMPSYYVELVAMPLTGTGKIDRRSLPEPTAERPDLGNEYKAPKTPVEDVLAGIWGELLGVEKVGIEDDFFELGGHSLLVARLTARVRTSLKAELPLRAVFDHPTIAGLAKLVEAGGTTSGLPELPPLERYPRDGRRIPLSFAQQRVWFLDRLRKGGNKAYNFQIKFWFHGPFDVHAFYRTLDELTRRHEILRTSFPEVDGEPVQVIHPHTPPPMPVIDLSGLSELDRDTLPEGLVFIATQIPFDISKAPLIRWWMLRLEPEYHEMVQVEQHFVHDGWSFSVMLREMQELYRAFKYGRPSPLAELPVQYADYALWQRGWMEGEVMERMLAYWKTQLAGVPTALELPTDRPRPEQPTFLGNASLRRIPTHIYEALRKFSRREGFTLYMTSLAAFFVFLSRYSGQSDVLVGTTNANRRARETEGLIGMIVNTLVLRGDMKGDPTFRQLLARVREMTLGAYSYQDMPLERLVHEIAPARHLGMNPLFQVLFQFHDAAMPDLDFDGVQTRFLMPGNRSAKMDLTAIVIPRAEQRVGMAASEETARAFLQWEHSTELFDDATADRMAEHYIQLLEAAVADPDAKISQLPMMSPSEVLEIEAWNAGSVLPLHRWGTVAEAFAERLADSPNAPAVEGQGLVWSYAELDLRASTLARKLVALGAGPEKLVAVALSRSLGLVATLLAIAKTGAAYLPLDADFPRDRLAFMLHDAGVAALVTEEKTAGRLPLVSCPVLSLGDGLPAADGGGSFAPVAVLPTQLAYVLYTSGSTGVPKGVEIPFGALANFLASMAVSPGFTRQDCLLAVTTISFDIAGLELYLPLVAGGRLVLASTEMATDGVRLAAEIARVAPTVMQATPATWRMLLDDGWKPSPTLTVLVGGEALPQALAQELAGAASLWNLYGPTETTIWSAIDAVDAEQPITIGLPIAATSLWVAGRRGELVPVGVHGQLLIGGAGLARGYRGRPAATAERFVPDPYSRQPGGRLYATGDLVKHQSDGKLRFLGRIDSQVKVRGFRIELGEVEAALASHPGVAKAVAAVRTDEASIARLVGYVVAQPGTEAPGAEDLSTWLRQSLPSYMVPTAFVSLPVLPLTPNGKIDRKALPEPTDAPQSLRHEFVAPRTELEKSLASIWSEVLRLDKVGVTDSFFVLGGHSLAAGRVLARVRDRLGVDLPLSVMFDTPTIEALAAAVEQAGEPLLKKAAGMSDTELDALLTEMMATGGKA